MGGYYKKVSYDRSCAYCGKQFTAHNKRGIYCSKQCKDIEIRLRKGLPVNPNTEPYHKTCVICGKPFDTRRDSAKTCSSECSRKRRQKHDWSSAPTQRDPRICVACGAIFMPRLEKQITCSKRCWREFHRSEKPTKPAPNPVEHTCENCGATFLSDPTHARKYCSKMCANANKRKGKDKRIPSDRRIDNINLKKLFKRDGGKCYLCGGDCNWSDWRTARSGAKYPGDTYPTIDHILPVSKGGCDSWDNVRLAHWICNLQKSDAIVDDDGMTMQFAYSAKGKGNPPKKTAQYTLGGELVRIWESTAQIRREAGFNEKRIQSVCRGDKSRTGNAFGFHWEYLDA